MMDVHVQPIVHYTFIPLIIVLGMTMTGELTLCFSHPHAILPYPGRSSFTSHPSVLSCMCYACSLREARPDR